MTAPHEEEHEELLMQVVTGSRAHDDPEVVARIAACAECRQLLAGISALQVDLEQAGVQERAEVRDALAEPPRATDAEVAARFQGVVAARPDRESRVARGAIAAAALLILSVTLYYLLAADDAGETVLGGGDIVLEAPLGRVDPGPLEFRWRTATTDALTVYEIQLRSTDRGVFERHRTDAGSWRVPEARRTGWPDRFEWRVVEAFAPSPRASSWVEVVVATR